MHKAQYKKGNKSQNEVIIIFIFIIARLSGAFLIYVTLRILFKNRHTVMELVDIQDFVTRFENKIHIKLSYPAASIQFSLIA